MLAPQRNSVGAAHRAGGLGLYSFLLATLAVPKAGLKLGSYPLNASTIASLIVSAFVVKYWKDLSRSGGHRTARWIRFNLVISVGLTLLSFVEHGFGPTMERFAPVLLPVATVPWLCRQIHSGADVARAVLQVAWLPVLYGYLQLVVGRSTVVVPGITVNLSDWQALGEGVFSSKNNATSVGLKLTSTYQNGNLYGVFLVALFALLLARATASRATKADLALLGLVVPSLLLTLSRTALIGAAAAALIAVAARRGRRVVPIVLIITAVGVIVSRLDLGARILNLDTTGAGRVPLYAEYFRELQSMSIGPLVRQLLIGAGPGVDGLRGLTAVERLTLDGIPFVENVMMNLVLMGGLTLTVAYLGPVLRAVRDGISARAKGAHVVGPLSATGALFVYFSIDQSLNLPPSASIFWLMYALLVAAATADRGDIPADAAIAGSEKLGKTVPTAEPGDLRVSSICNSFAPSTSLAADTRTARAGWLFRISAWFSGFLKGVGHEGRCGHSAATVRLARPAES